jgi:hypothetical protein
LTNISLVSPTQNLGFSLAAPGNRAGLFSSARQGTVLAVQMTKAPRAPRVDMRLSPADFVKFEQLRKIKSKRRTALAREAILWYLKNHERLEAQLKDSESASRLKKIADRICGPLYKLGIEAMRLLASSGRRAMILGATSLNNAIRMQLNVPSL